MSSGDRKFWAELDQLGPEKVRINLAQGVYTKRKAPLVKKWLLRQQATAATPADHSTKDAPEHPYWKWIGRIAAVVTVVGVIFGLGVKFGQTRLGQQWTGVDGRSSVPVLERLTLQTSAQSALAPELAEERAAIVQSVPGNPEVSPRPRDLFIPGDPFPWPFTNYKLGTRMSVLLAAFPGTEFRSQTISIPFPEGPFGTAYYFFDYDRIDPQTESAFFVPAYKEGTYIPDEEAVADVWRQVLGAFQSFPYEESRIEKAVYWDDVNGYSLSLTDEGLSVRRATRSP